MQLQLLENMDSNESVTKSSIWQHFTRSDDKSTAQCIECKKSLKTAGGSTSSLHKHLKTVHSKTTEKKTVADTSTQPSTSCTENRVQIPKKKKRMTDFFESYSNPNMETMVSRMVSLDGMPFRIFTTSADLRYLFERRGHHLPKSPNTIREIVIREYSEKKEEVTREIKRILSQDHKFSISFDEWSSKGNKRYLSLTLHSPEFEGASKFRSLGLLRIYGSMNARQCIVIIRNELQNYGIDFEQDVVAQTTDGCSLMVKFGRLVDSIHQLCVAHAIQLAIIDIMYKNADEVLRSAGYYQLIEIVEDDEEDMTLAELSTRMRNEEVSNTDDSDADEEDGVLFLNDAIIPGAEIHESGLIFQDIIKKVRKVVKMFKKSPVKNDEVLQKHVLSDFKREYTLLLDVQTRWSSMAIMISRFLKLKGPITKSLIDLQSDVRFSEREWKTLQDIDAILNIVQTIVEVVCRRDATILTVDVAVKFALRKLREISSDLSLKMEYALARRYGQRRLKQVSVLQYLTNPTSYFSDNDNTFGQRISSDEMCAELADMVKGHLDITKNNNHLQNSDTDPSHMLSLSIEDELNQEIIKATSLEKPSAHTGDPSVAIRLEMALYENGGQKGRYLTMAYSRLLTIQPTSVEPERIFSSAGMICSRLRTSLSDHSLMAISFLRTYFLEKRQDF